METEVVLPRPALMMRDNIQVWIIQIVGSTTAVKSEKIPEGLPRVTSGFDRFQRQWCLSEPCDCLVLGIKKSTQNNSLSAQACRHLGFGEKINPEALLENNRINPIDLLKKQEAGEEEGDVSYWEWSSSFKCNDHILKKIFEMCQKSTENKGMPNLTLKEIPSR